MFCTQLNSYEQPKLGSLNYTDQTRVGYRVAEVLKGKVPVHRLQFPKDIEEITSSHEEEGILCYKV